MLIPVYLSGKTIFAELKTRRLARGLRLTVKDSTVTIAAPYGTPLPIIKNFLQEKAKWIEKHLVLTPPPSLFQWEAPLILLGHTYLLKNVSFPLKKVVEEENVLWLKESLPQSKALLVDFCKEKAHTFFHETCQQYAQQLGVKYKHIKIREMTSRWGSCSSQGSLTFNWRLVLTPHAVASYVAAHEIAHLKEMNHSPKFWRVVESLDPHYKKSRQWLKNQGKTLLTSR